MMRCVTLGWFCCLILLAIPAPLRAEVKKTDAMKRFLLFYSNDVRGELEPCG